MLSPDVRPVASAGHEFIHAPRLIDQEVLNEIHKRAAARREGLDEADVHGANEATISNLGAVVVESAPDSFGLAGRADRFDKAA